MRKLAVTVPPFNSTLMGCVRGVSDHFGLAHPTPWLYGASGHAFVMNVHKDLCPSGPYCWDRKGFVVLLRNLGIVMVDLGSCFGDSKPEERSVIEARLRAEIDAGRPAGLVNMEFQLVTGYDETGFDTTQPWPGMDFPPSRLSYGSWAEMGEVHAGFFGFADTQPSSWEDAVRASLCFASGLYDDPQAFEWEGYGMGPNAIRNWKAAVLRHGDTHGNWWNACVWGECRRRASEFFEEIAERLSYPVAQQLAGDYREMADLLAQVEKKDSPLETKLESLQQLERREREAMDKVRVLHDAL